MKQLLLTIFLIIFLIACSVVTNTNVNGQKVKNTETTAASDITVHQKKSKPQFLLESKLDQFGNEGFTANFDGGQVGIGEHDGIIYVVSKHKEEYFVSIAKDEKWIKKDESTPAPDHSSFLDKFYLIENIVFIETKNESGQELLLAYTLDKDGKVVKIQQIPKEAVILRTSAGPGLLIFSKSTNTPHELTLFNNQSENPILISDNKHVLPEKLKNAEASFLNLKNHILYYSNFGTYGFDTLTGDLGTDQAGNQLRVKESYQYITMLNQDYLTMIQQSDGKVRIIKYNEQLQPFNPNEQPQPFGYWKFITTAQHKIHFWKDLDYKHEPSISLLSISE